MAAGKTYPTQPKDVPPVQTRWRRIATQVPAPESVPILEELRRYEPRSMSGQPPVVWDRAQGCQVHDAWGNTWLDWSSGVLVTNAGHCHPLIQKAIIEQAEHGLIHNYCFPSELRARLSKTLVDCAPDGIDKAFLLTTGSEATECAIKLSRARGVTRHGPQKNVIVTFTGAFHGRTLGAQQAGGIPALKEWIVNLDPGFVQVPFPDGFRCEDVSFGVFESVLAEAGIESANVAGVMMETYLGGGASFAPAEYVQAMRKWTRGAGRAPHHGRGAGGLRPHGHVLGLRALRHRAGPDLLRQGHLQRHAAQRRAGPRGRDGPVRAGQHDEHAQRQPRLRGGRAGQRRGGADRGHGGAVGARGRGAPPRAAARGRALPAGGRRVARRGMVAGVHLIVPGSKDPNGELAHNVVQECYERGLLMFAPVGLGGGTLKICPPLVTPEEAVHEGVGVLLEAMEAAK